MNSFVTAAASSLLAAVMLGCALHWTATSRLLLTEQPKMPAFCSPLTLRNVRRGSTAHRTGELAIFVFLWWCEMWSEVHVCEDLCVCGGGSQVEAEAAFNKLEIHFHALVSLSFRVNNCPGFGSILQAQPQCYRTISPTCFGFTTFRLAFPCAYVCNIWL